MKFKSIIFVCVILCAMLFISGCTETDNRFVKAVYDNEPRLGDGHINVSGMVYWIKASNSNTYNYLIWHSEYDWEDLPGFLEEAEKEGIDVWITLSPPQETVSQPFGIDYMKWAEEISKLSLEYPCIKAWSIDNILLFASAENEQYFSGVFSKARGINPKLEFIPVVYYSDVQSANFGVYGKYFNGVQFYYKVFPSAEGFGGYQQAEAQIKGLRSIYSGKIIFGIYATPWQEAYPTTANYVKELIKIAKENADGVVIYTMQTEGEKFDVIKEGFK
ncbi:MAG: hypothetical protein JW716_05440 [Candidatus Aenigmarchaeota archaeon]|nr:hypothetical protein [Candidatus Aenigmarchaeota archaeon]